MKILFYKKEGDERKEPYALANDDGETVDFGTLVIVHVEEDDGIVTTYTKDYFYITMTVEEVEKIAATIGLHR